MSGGKCKNCGCTEIDVDPARGDAVCTNCGSVLEDSIIVSEIQFEENAHGGSSALGQFVSADSKGGARGFGGSFHAGLGKESREITLNNARHAITNLAQQLRLNQHCIDTAFNFYKMALTRHLTRGRKNSYVIAACVYMTCRIEGTPHLLIDFSDVLQTCVYELGRTYLRLSQALCINIPAMVMYLFGIWLYYGIARTRPDQTRISTSLTFSMQPVSLVAHGCKVVPLAEDVLQFVNHPCLYILRFANRLEFGDKTHEVSMTALRLVQRMKRDFIHSGRRPSGLCGAALLMAARLHEFNRTVNDIIKIVKVHESTVRKRLIEFGDTPSSALTLDEFMTVDLEEEQDPPSFKVARQKDKERLQKLIEEEAYANSFNELQKEIYRALEAQAKNRKRSKKGLICESETEESQESEDADRFIAQSTLGTIQEYVADDPTPVEGPSLQKDASQGLGPDIVSMRLVTSMDDCPETEKGSPAEDEQGNGEIDLTGIDDDEIDSYIMNEREAQFKDTIWMKMNEQYLKEQKEKQEKLEKEREEGKPEKKKRKTTTKKKTSSGAANSAGEAIEKMLQEKKISTKINYEVLKSLNVQSLETTPSSPVKEPSGSKPSLLRARPSSNALKASLDSRKTADLLLETMRSSKKPAVKTAPKTDASPRKNRTSITEPGSPPAATKSGEQEEEPVKADAAEPPSEPYADDEFEEEAEVEPDQGDHLSLAQMLNHHREDDDYYGDYDYDEY